MKPEVQDYLKKADRRAHSARYPDFVLSEKSQNSEAAMETLKTKSIIGADRRLRIDMEVPLPPGPVEVVVVVSPEAGPLPAGIDPEAVRQRFLAAAGCGESGDPLSSRRVDEILYGRKL